MSTVKGKLIVINQKEQVSEKFAKRTAVIETADQYPQLIEVQFTNDKCDLLDTFFGGENVEVSINVRGRRWTNQEGIDKYFTTLEAWKIQTV